MKSKTTKLAILFVTFSALLYAIGTPINKLLLAYFNPTMLSGLLYLGAGLGMTVIFLIQKIVKKTEKELPLEKKDIPFLALMVALDVVANIGLMVGLTMTSAADVSLLSNFEIVVTSLFALIIFKEVISPRLGIGIGFIFIASILISIDFSAGFSISAGSLFVLLGCLAWGLENNITRKLSAKNPLQVTLVKGFGVGICSLLIAFLIGERITNYGMAAATIGIGIVTYGVSIFCFISAQRHLGASKTSAFFASAPFFGVLFSCLIFWTFPNYWFFIAIAIMILGVYFVITEKRQRKKPPIENIQSGD
ncbi:MAG: DMT family transporter [Firmicutes bacterium]|nr:DMT family transporter [Bacillota bacterium]